MKTAWTKPFPQLLTATFILVLASWIGIASTAQEFVVVEDHRSISASISINTPGQIEAHSDAKQPNSPGTSWNDFLEITAQLSGQTLTARPSMDSTVSPTLLSCKSSASVLGSYEMTTITDASSTFRLRFTVTSDANFTLSWRLDADVGNFYNASLYLIDLNSSTTFIDPLVTMLGYINYDYLFQVSGKFIAGHVYELDARAFAEHFDIGAPASVGRFAVDLQLQRNQANTPWRGWFSNEGPILIGDQQPAQPYPSSITVNNTLGEIWDLWVVLEGFNHSSPEDVDILLVGPDGQQGIVMSDAGGWQPPPYEVRVSLLFRDDLIPRLGEFSIASGEYSPTDYGGTTDFFAPPAPAPPYTLGFGHFFDRKANGEWTLYILDDSGFASGSIAGGWKLFIVTKHFIQGLSDTSVRSDTTFDLPFVIVHEPGVRPEELSVSVAPGWSNLLAEVSVTGFGTNWVLHGRPIRGVVGATDLSVTARSDFGGETKRSTTTIHVTVTGREQSLTFDPSLVTSRFGDPPRKLRAKSSAGLRPVYQVEGPGLLTDDSLTITGAGVILVTASQPGDASFLPAGPVKQTNIVLQATQTLDYRSASSATYGDPPIALDALASSGLPVTFQYRSGPGSLSGNSLTITGAGTIGLLALQPGTPNYEATSLPIQITIRKATQSLSFLSPTTLAYGDAPTPLIAMATSGLPVDFEVTNGPGSLSGNLLTCTGPGFIAIRAYQPGDQNYEATELSLQIPVARLRQTITFHAPTTASCGGAPERLVATASSGLPVEFVLIGGSASLDGDFVTFRGSGKLDLLAVQSGNELYGATQLPVTLSVRQGAQTLSLLAPEAMVLGGPPVRLGALASSGLEVTLELLSGPARLADGFLTATGPGEIRVRASQPGNDCYAAAAPVDRTILVAAPPTIQTHPLSQHPRLGQPFVLTVLATGTPPLSYQWYKNGQPLPGELKFVLSRRTFQTSDGGAYSVQVSNLLGQVVSVPAIVQPDLPAVALADRFADRRTFSDLRFRGITNNTRATRDSGEPLHAKKGGAKSLWMAWRSPQSGIARFDTSGSSFDTLLAVYTGQTLADLHVVAADEDSGGYLTSAVTFNAEAGVEYHVAVDGYAGASGELVMSWELTPTTIAIPQIDEPPASQVASVGQPLVLQVAARGPDLRYQWQRNGLPIPGATNATLALPTVSPESAGAYAVEIIGAGDLRITSELARVEVIAQPLGQHLSALGQDKLEDLLVALFGPSPRGRPSPQVVGGGSGYLSVSVGVPNGQLSYDNFGATTQIREPNACNSLVTRSLWYAFRAEQDGVLELTNRAPGLEALLGVYTNRAEIRIIEGTPTLEVFPNLVPVACSAPDSSPASDSFVRFEMRAGVYYFAQVDAAWGQVGRLDLVWTFSSALQVRGAPTWKNGVLHVGYEVLPGAYDVHHSADLNAWTHLLDTNVLGTILEIDAPLPMNSPQRFLRLRRLTPLPSGIRQTR